MPSRRETLQMALAPIGIAFGVHGLAAAADGGDVYTPRGLARDLPADAGTLPGATFARRGRFDLSDPVDLRLARLKTLASLSGSKTYFSTLSRHILCPPGKTPYPLVTEVELTTIFLERAEEHSPEQAVIRAVFTRVPLDPITFEPITALDIPYTGKRVRLRDTLFAGGNHLIDVNPRDKSARDIMLQPDQPHYRFGDDMGFIMFDPREGTGEWQPRVDTVVWRVNYEKLMDPAVDPVEADYTFSALMRASVFGWTGIDEDDRAQMFSMKVGKKFTSLEQLPSLTKKRIVDQYPDRV